MSTQIESLRVSRRRAGIGDYLAVIGRVMIAAIFLISGYGKIAAPAATIAYIASAHLPLPVVSYVIAVFVEIGGGLALLVGLRARPVAIVLAVFTIATALAFHVAFNDQSQTISFLKNVAMAGGLLNVAVLGSGLFALRPDPAPPSPEMV